MSKKHDLIRRLEDNIGILSSVERHIPRILPMPCIVSCTGTALLLTGKKTFACRNFNLFCNPTALIDKASLGLLRKVPPITPRTTLREVGMHTSIIVEIPALINYMASAVSAALFIKLLALL